MGYSLRVNQKSIESGNKNPPDPADRDNQFKYIEIMREQSTSSGNQCGYEKERINRKL